MVTDEALKAIINMKALSDRVSFNRWAPSESMSDIIEIFWAISWDLPEGEVFHQQLIPNPHANLMIYPEGLFVDGVVKQLFDYGLTGKGDLLGAKFRIGGLNALCNESMKALVNARLPADAVFGGPKEKWLKPIDMTDQKSQSLWLEQLLAGYGTSRSEGAREAERVLRILRDHPDIHSAAGLASACGLSLRTVQRLVETYTGVNPKWLIRVMRLQELKALYETNHQVNWSEVAAQLGYADQAHLIRDFKSFFGAPPKGYFGELPRG